MQFVKFATGIMIMTPLLQLEQHQHDTCQPQKATTTIAALWPPTTHLLGPTGGCFPVLRQHLVQQVQVVGGGHLQPAAPPQAVQPLGPCLASLRETGERQGSAKWVW